MSQSGQSRVVRWCHLALRVLWCILLAWHIWAMICYWWPMKAHGFPAIHLRFWVNEALPWILSTFCLLGIIFAWRRHNRLFSLIIFTIPVIYAAVAIAGLLIFPKSAARDLRRMFDPGWLFDSFLFKYGFWLPLLCWAGLLGLLAGLTAWRRRSLLMLGLAVTIGCFLGVIFIWAQRADDPSTHPAAQVIPSLPEYCEPIPKSQALHPQLHRSIQNPP